MVRLTNLILIIFPPLNRITIPCRFDTFGCEVVLPHHEREGHEEKCEFRMTPCIQIKCKTTVLSKTFRAHLADHKTEFIPSAFGKSNFLTVGNTSEWQKLFVRAKTNLKLNTQQYVTLRIEDHLFVFNLLLTSGIWHFWLWFDSTPEEAEKMECTITFVDNLTDNKPQSIPLNSVNKFWRDIVSSGSCLMVPDETVEKSYNRKGKLRIKYTVRKKL